MFWSIWKHTRDVLSRLEFWTQVLVCSRQSSSPPCGVSNMVHASAHLGKVHVWSPGVWTVEAQVSGSDGLARGFDARERGEDLLWFWRFSCWRWWASFEGASAFWAGGIWTWTAGGWERSWGRGFGLRLWWSWCIWIWSWFWWWSWCRCIRSWFWLWRWCRWIRSWFWLWSWIRSCFWWKFWFQFQRRQLLVDLLEIFSFSRAVVLLRDIWAFDLHLLLLFILKSFLFRCIFCFAHISLFVFYLLRIIKPQLRPCPGDVPPMRSHMCAPGRVMSGPNHLILAGCGVGLRTSTVMDDLALWGSLTGSGPPAQEKMVDHRGGTDLGGKDTGGWTLICEESISTSKKTLGIVNRLSTWKVVSKADSLLKDREVL